MTVATNIADSGKEIFVYDENIIVDEGKVEKKMSKSRVRSRALRDAAIDYYSSEGIIRCVVCGFSYEEKYGEIGKGYIEIHHEKPICEYGVEGKAQFISDAIWLFWGSLSHLSGLWDSSAIIRFCFFILSDI